MAEPLVSLDISAESVTRARRRLQVMALLFEESPRPVVQAAAEIYKSRLKAHAPKRTGALSGSHIYRTRKAGRGWSARFFALKYAAYVIQGTGLYGPRHAMIVPTTKQALYWDGAAHPVKSVKGQKPNDYREPAAEEAIPLVAAVLREAGKRVVEDSRI